MVQGGHEALDLRRDYLLHTCFPERRNVDELQEVLDAANAYFAAVDRNSPVGKTRAEFEIVAYMAEQGHKKLRAIVERITERKQYDRSNG